MLRTVPFYYLRHGETDWNREGRFQGTRDIPLNAYGELQAQNAAHLLRNEPIACICTSPLQRAMRTAEIVNEMLRLPVIPLDGLSEVGFGEWEGTVIDNTAIARWRRGETPSGAEPTADFHDRVLRAINAALDRPGPVLIVGHGVFYRAMERHATFALPSRIPNAIPILHDPPGDPSGWTRRILDGRDV